MRRPRHDAWWRYAAAAAVTLLALLLRVAAGHWFYATSTFLFFTPAVMFAAWYGGFGPGLVTTVTGAVLIIYFLLAPFYTFVVPSAEVGRLVLFGATGVQISWLSGEMYTARRRAEADALAARRSERLYRTLASNFPDGFVCLFDGDLRWTLVAGAGLQMAGLSREQMEGRAITDTLPPKSASRVCQICNDALSGNVRVDEIGHSGRIYRCHAIPLRTRAEATPGGMIILEDVTERARAREALQWAHDSLERRVRERTAELHFQKTLLESQSQASADGILAIGNDGRIFFTNRRFSDLWRLSGSLPPYTLEEIRTRMRQQLESPQDPLATDDALPDVGEGNVAEMVLNSGRTFERYSAPIVDPEGTSYGRVWFFRDITERKRMQRQILEAGERERQRIGQDLHDDLCQQLTGIACLARALQQRLAKRTDGGDAGEAATAAAAGDIVQMVQRANQRARDLAKGLQPVNLMRQGLSSALQELCESFEAIFHVSCTFQGVDGAITPDEAIGIQLYRIAQEAMSNAVRHGRAKAVRVDLVPLHDRLILSVEDDGVGIPKPLPHTGLGLYTMSYRARLIGGTLSIDSPHFAGTTVTCSVPLRTHQPTGSGPSATPRA